MQTQISNDRPATATMPRRAYSIAHAASILGVHRATVHRLVQAGKLRAISGFGVLKISDIELDRFLQQTKPYRQREMQTTS